MMWELTDSEEYKERWYLMPSGRDHCAGESLERLLEGNRRFMQGIPQHPRQEADSRRALLGGQEPFAVILGCSDSRIPPEILFDQGIGDLFVIRVAGNIFGDVALASIEYAVVHLGVSLVLVLGHSSCGAVTATLSGGSPQGHLGALTERIRPAVSEYTRTVVSSDPAATDSRRSARRVDEAACANAQAVAARLRESEPILRPRDASGEVVIAAAFYDMASGQTRILGE